MKNKTVKTKFKQNEQSYRHDEQINNLTKNYISSMKDDDKTRDQHRPSWRFDRYNPKKWCIKEVITDEEGNTHTVLIETIIEKLRGFEQQTWGQIFNSDGCPNHSIHISKLNKCARKRLRELMLDADIDRIISLRLQAKVRLYGFFQDDSALSILWYDTDHGDNDTCVVRSRLKYT